VGWAGVPGELAKHVAVVLRHEDALEDDVVADACAVADSVRYQADVVPVRHIVLAQNHPAEMVLLDDRCPRPETVLQRARQGALASGRVASQHNQVRFALHAADASPRPSSRPACHAPEGRHTTAGPPRTWWTWKRALSRRAVPWWLDCQAPSASCTGGSSPRAAQTRVAT
jgi:hypothetical protein